ncbi:MAG: hypothetical protein ABIR47_17245 [Candidatus Kapaibacterium sp.]
MSDIQTNLPDTDYFFLGDGRLMAVIQWSRNPGASPYGILICDPERMSRKQGALLFHPELGLSRTMLSVIVNGVRHQPRHEDVQAMWDFNGGPAVVIRWKAGDVEVSERFRVQEPSSHLIRDVTIISPDDTTPIEIQAALYANPLYFDEFGTRPEATLYAAGYTSITLYSVPSGRAFERFLTVRPELPRNGVAATFIYGIEAVGTHEFSLYPGTPPFPSLNAEAGPAVTLGTSFGATLRNTEGEDHPPSLAAHIHNLYTISRTSLRASVSQLGKFDASIWQYDFEWGMDAAMVATAAVTAGMFDLARQILVNIFRRLSNADGMIAEASRFRDGEMAELNGNGAVLDAIWHYWRWTGDTALPLAHWRRITAIADYPLRPEFGHPSGLLKTRRDFWERNPWMGVDDGFEIGHQVFCSVGLRHAAEMAEALGRNDEAARWSNASQRILDAMINHPELSLIENGRFIKRRRADGSVQETLIPEAGYRSADYAPYIPVPPANATPLPCEPDITQALPIIYGLIDPASPIALATMEHLRSLWNPMGNGGYARYNIASDPDSPGAWAFASAFMAAAEIETGLEERAAGTIAWLLDMAGRGGSWFEYYGPRQSPPYPPVGIIVWGWAQYLLLVVKHIVGVSVSGDQMVIAPKLTGIDHDIRFGGHRVRIAVRGRGSALLDGAPIALDGGAARLSLPLTADHLLEFMP